MKALAVLVTLTLTIAASADPPCRQILPVHQQIGQSINAATIFADTYLNIVEVPVPAFVFQTLTAYQPQIQQVAVQAPVAQQPPVNDGVGTDDQLASLLGIQKQAQQQISPLAEISQKCGSCHSGGAAKGGLTLIDAQGQYNPATIKNNALTRAMIALRAQSTGEDAMPPGVNANPAKRLSDTSIRFLEQ